MSNIKKLKRYQAWRTGEDERTLTDAINFNISDAINGVIEEHVEMREELEVVSNWLNKQLGMGDWYKDIEKLLAKARGEL